MYKIAFEESGFETLVASTGKDGIEIARAQNPNVVLLDILMPEFNGLDTLKKLKEDVSLLTLF